MIDLCMRLINRRAGIAALFLLGIAPPVSGGGQDRSSRPSRAESDFPAFELPPLSESSSLDRSVTDEQNPIRRPRSSRLDEALPLDPVRPDPLEVDTWMPRSDATADDVRSPRSNEMERRSLPAGDAEQIDTATFDWSQPRLSDADIGIGQTWPFRHGKSNFTDKELDAYVILIRAVMDLKSGATREHPESVSLTSSLETAFYRFSDVRRQAWENKKLSLQLKNTEPADPFASGSSTVISTTDREFDATDLRAYSQQMDMQVHPTEFVGRPVVMYGMFTPLEAVELQAKETLEGEPGRFQMQRGYLRNLTNTETIAMVDVMSYIDSDSQNTPMKAWPVDVRVAMPVLIKGWFVKLLGRNPLLFTDVARKLTPRPYDEHIREQVRSDRRVSHDESWLYHETLRQLQVTDRDMQAAIALQEQQNRVTELLQEIREKSIADRQVLENEFRNGTITRNDEGPVEGYETRRTRLERQLRACGRRCQSYRNHPESFPLFADILQNPGRWHGRLVTLRGHVRLVTTHDGDAAMFNRQPLHELWLFTDDSQNSPTVILTPALPKDFPVSADVIETVTVTGCFFKMHVYRSQNENRTAPLLLAGHVSWSPTSEQVRVLAKDGHIPASSKLLTAARMHDPDAVSDTMILLLGFVSLLAAMTVWGRIQRDRREHHRLMLLVDDRPVFRHTSQDLFSGPFADPGMEPIRG